MQEILRSSFSYLFFLLIILSCFLIIALKQLKWLKLENSNMRYLLLARPNHKKGFLAEKLMAS